MQTDTRQYFKGIAAKYLTKVDAEPAGSNQHEIGGLPTAGFTKLLGLPQGGKKRHIDCREVYLSDDLDEPIFQDDVVTWYDTRWNDPSRSAEYRLYYKSNLVTESMNEGDLCLIALKSDDELLMVFAPRGSSSEAQILNIFQITELGSRIRSVPFKGNTESIAVRMLLDDLGIEYEVAQESEDKILLSMLIDRFPGDFPTTREFSAFARTKCGNRHEGADDQLVAWMEFEEKLFRLYEKHLLESSFIREARVDSIDSLINFSLSVHNRRKARAGLAFENHLRQLFVDNDLNFEQGSTHQTTENRAKPDFLFPGFDAYHSASFPIENLRLLGAKTSCKDRWRQVLAEGDKVARKHLVTLQPGVSENQLLEMNAQGVQLIVPTSIQLLFKSSVREQLMSVSEFIADVHTTQSVEH